MSINLSMWILMLFVVIGLLIALIGLAIQWRRQRKLLARYDLLTETMYDIFWMMDVETNRFVYVSPSVERMRGYSVAEIMQESVDAALTEEAKMMVRKAIAEEKQKFLDGQKTEKDYEVHQLPQPCKDGSVVWTEVITHFFNDPVTHKVFIHGVTRDITERHKLDEQVRFLANHDALTRLLNRHAFFATGEVWFWNAKHQQSLLIYLQFDLNGFKPINDTFGHHVGDEVLKFFAQRLSETFTDKTQPQRSLIARLGGDEFSVLLSHSSLASIQQLCQQLQTQLAQPITINGQEIQFSTAIGLAQLETQQNLAELAIAADQDLYRHKHEIKK